MSALLTPYTLEELAAAAPADPAAPVPTPVRVKTVQADLFNDQGALFGHVKQPGEMD